MKLEDIKVGMRVEVSTPVSDFGNTGYEDEYKGKVGVVISTNSLLPYPIKVDLGFATENFKPEELESTK